MLITLRSGQPFSLQNENIQSYKGTMEKELTISKSDKHHSGAITELEFFFQVGKKITQNVTEGARP